MSNVNFWGDGFNGSPPKTSFADWKAPSYSWSPSYQGLEGGDYDRLEQNLRTPGEQAAKQGYDQQSRDMNAAMSGRGMYGSSLMSQAANEGLNREYQNALTTNAANAVAKRYAMQTQDRQFAAGQNLQRDTMQNQLTRADTMAYNNYQMQQAAWNDQQNMRAFQFDASKAQSRQAFDFATQNYNDQRNDLAAAQFNQAFRNFYGTTLNANQNSGASGGGGSSSGGGDFLGGLGSGGGAGLGQMAASAGMMAMMLL